MPNNLSNTINSNQVKYPVNEIFATIQGEATFTGTPSVFIRLQGCEVGCPWCDTKHTWNLDTKNMVNFDSIIAQSINNKNYAQASVKQISNFIQIKYPQIKHIVITGGEPTKYDLRPLSITLEALGKDIQIETSGTEVFQITDNTWVSLSPKINMPKGKVIIDSCISRANEIKMPIGKMADIEKLQNFLAQNTLASNVSIWLQPLSQNVLATQLCIEQALLHNWHLSLQTHKFINIR